MKWPEAIVILGLFTLLAVMVWQIASCAAAVAA